MMVFQPKQMESSLATGQFFFFPLVGIIFYFCIYAVAYWMSFDSIQQLPVIQF